MRDTAILAAAFIACGALLPISTAVPAIAQEKKLPCADIVQGCLRTCSSSSVGQAKNQCEERCVYNGVLCKKGRAKPEQQGQADTPMTRKAMEATRLLPCKFGPRGPFYDKSKYCR